MRFDRIENSVDLHRANNQSRNSFGYAQQLSEALVPEAEYRPETKGENLEYIFPAGYFL